MIKPILHLFHALQQSPQVRISRQHHKDRLGLASVRVRVVLRDRRGGDDHAPFHPGGVFGCPAGGSLVGVIHLGRARRVLVVVGHREDLGDGSMMRVGRGGDG